MRASVMRIALALAALAAHAHAHEFYCFTSPSRGTDTVVPYSVGKGTVYTRVRSREYSPDMRNMTCYLYYSYIAADEQGRPTTTQWGLSPHTKEMDIHIASPYWH
eukprot:m51a1_g13676 hypothetical protein (105) ;mRNA; f:1522-2013